MTMQVAFRVDASTRMGTGHVMRCLTLADALRARGARCLFVCREHKGHLIELIRQRGHDAIGLPLPERDGSASNFSGDLAHSAWLGADWDDDAARTAAVLNGSPRDWLVVDHYALDARWETALRPCYRKLMVIDDLADREHVCDLLLDQNLTEDMESRYRGKIPADCIALIGPRHALLRPEFAELRPKALARRRTPVMERLLIFMGGSDPENETGKAVAGVARANRRWRHVDVVVGQGFSALAALKDAMERLPSAALHIQTPDMAELMTVADLAVTAAGSVTWEKCALGLPSLVAILADNQREIAQAMHRRGALRIMGVASDLTSGCYAKHLDELTLDEIPPMIDHAARICDGSGAGLVLEVMEGFL